MDKIAKNVKIFGDLDGPTLALPKYCHIFSDFIEGDIGSTSASHRNTSWDADSWTTTFSECELGKKLLNIIRTSLNLPPKNELESQPKQKLTSAP